MGEINKLFFTCTYAVLYALVFGFAEKHMIIVAAQTGIDTCEKCCANACNLTSPELVDCEVELQFVTGCQIGCSTSDVSSSFTCQNLVPTQFCQFGFDLQKFGIATLGQTVWCSGDGVVDYESWVPTVQPTTSTPTDTPTTSSPTITVVDDPGTNFAVIGAIAGGGFMIVLATFLVIFVFRVKKEAKSDGLSSGVSGYISKVVTNSSRKSGAKAFDYLDRMEAANKEPKPVPKPAPSLTGRISVRPVGRFSFDSFASANRFAGTIDPPQNGRFDIRSFRPAQTLDSKPPEFIMLYDFVAEHDDELSLLEGDRVTGVYKADEEWWIVQKVGTNEQGLVPTSYMDEIFPDDVTEFDRAFAFRNEKIPENPGIPDFM